MTDQPAPRRTTGRLKMMMSHTWLMLIAAALACVGVGGSRIGIATQPVTLKIAVGPEGSEDARSSRPSPLTSGATGRACC